MRDGFMPAIIVMLGSIFTSCAATTMVDVSTGQEAMASSLYSADTPASLAVDGDTSNSHPNQWHNSIQVDNGSRSWWAVRLRRMVTNPTVQIWTRDCCVAGANMALGLDFFLANASTPTPSFASGTECGGLDNPTADTVTLPLLCRGTGSYLFIRNRAVANSVTPPVSGYMHLPEVRVEAPRVGAGAEALVDMMANLLERVADLEAQNECMRFRLEADGEVESCRASPSNRAMRMVLGTG